MVKFTRRSSVKAAGMMALPTVSGTVTATNPSRSTTNYVESTTVLDEVRHFPHPDEGEIVTSDGKFIYVEVVNGTDPDPQNSWIESPMGKHKAAIYPRKLWLDGQMKTTVFGELIDEEVVYRTVEGLLFEVPPGNTEITLYVDGEKQKLGPNVQKRVGRAKKRFNVTNIQRNHADEFTKIRMQVRNERPFESTFSACINVSAPVYYTQFIDVPVQDEREVVGEVYHGNEVSLNEVDLNIITGSARS